MRQGLGASLTVVVRLASGLQAHAGGVRWISLELAPPVTVGTVLDAVASAHPAVGRRLRDEAGTLRRHVNVFVGADNARDFHGEDTVVPEGVEVAILAAVSGG